MGLKVIITNHSTFINCSDEMNARWHSEISEKQPCYLPYGKADGTAFPSLSRVCGKLRKSIPLNMRGCTLDVLDLQHPRLLQR